MFSAILLVLRHWLPRTIPTPIFHYMRGPSLTGSAHPSLPSYFICAAARLVSTLVELEQPRCLHTPPLSWSS